MIPHPSSSALLYSFKVSLKMYKIASKPSDRAGDITTAEKKLTVEHGTMPGKNKSDYSELNEKLKKVCV
jgi:hypothetical protein